MKSLRTFLIVDENKETRYLLTKTLLRKFPNARLEEVGDFDSTMTFARKNEMDAIIVHRVWDADAATIIRELRAIQPNVPIIAVSGIDRAKATLAAGANRFMNYDEWLRIGSLVAELLGLSTGDTPQPPFPTPVRDAQEEMPR